MGCLFKPRPFFTIKCPQTNWGLMMSDELMKDGKFIKLIKEKFENQSEKELLTLTLKNGKIEIELSSEFLRKISIK